eukprot:347241-Chlamydomonas_euryale.AAC.7
MPHRPTVALRRCLQSRMLLPLLAAAALLSATQLSAAKPPPGVVSGSGHTVGFGELKARWDGALHGHRSDNYALMPVFMWGAFAPSCLFSVTNTGLLQPARRAWRANYKQTADEVACRMLYGIAFMIMPCADAVWSPSN